MLTASLGAARSETFAVLGFRVGSPLPADVGARELLRRVRAAFLVGRYGRGFRLARRAAYLAAIDAHARTRAFRWACTDASAGALAAAVAVENAVLRAELRIRP